MDLYRKVRLACAEGMSQREAARHFGISRDSEHYEEAMNVPNVILRVFADCGADAACQEAYPARAADVSQDAIDACIDSLRAQAGGGGGQVLSTEFSEANSLVMLQDGGGTVWRCLVSNDGANPYLEVSDAAPSGENPATADDSGGAMAGSMPADMPAVTGDVRVQFEPGTSGARYINRLGSGEAATYILGARDGQFLMVDLQGAVPNLDYLIYVPSGDILDQASQSSFHYEGQLYQSGDHKVEVFYNGNQGTFADFAINFEIR